MSKFVGVENGMKVLARVLRGETEARLAFLHLQWAELESPTLTEPEVAADALAFCNAIEMDDVNYCCCGMHGIRGGNIVIIAPEEPTFI